MGDASFRLRAMPALARLGISCLLLVLLGGYVASFAHMVLHHEGRDERPGLTVDDLRGAYHGLRSEAPLLRALKANHPAELDGATPLADDERDTLLDWLGSERISEDYDNLDLGDMAPAEIIAVSCLDCHARNADLGDGIGEEIPLEFWDDIAKVSFSRDVNPNPMEIVVTSLHTHGLSLAVVGLVLALLLAMTRWPRAFLSWAVALIGVGLLADLGGQILVRSSPALVWLIVVGGFFFGGASVVATLAVLADLWLPRPR